MIHLVVGVVVAVHVMAYCGYYACRWGMLTLGKKSGDDDGGLDVDVILGIVFVVSGALCRHRGYLYPAAVLLGCASGVVLWQVVQRAQKAGVARARPRETGD